MFDRQLGGGLEINRDRLDGVARTTETAAERHLGADPNGSSLPEDTQSDHGCESRFLLGPSPHCSPVLSFFQLFMACLCNLQAAQILNEIDTARLFSNLPEIYVANRQFWADHVFPMLKNARSARSPLDPALLREGFLKVALSYFL